MTEFRDIQERGSPSIVPRIHLEIDAKVVLNEATQIIFLSYRLSPQITQENTWGLVLPRWMERT
jgi:hypothetical protein